MQPRDTESGSVPKDFRSDVRDLDRVPVVYVAMATYNGRQWIESQVRSILNQEGVNVRLVVSDDQSTDGTRQWVQDLADRDDRVTLLPPRSGEPGLAANFLYALTSVHPKADEFVAFSDQDDLWRPGKLKRQVNLIRQHGVDAVSSNVLSFRKDPDGTLKRKLIRKDQPQAEWDFIFEAPGTGSSFLLSATAWEVVDRQVQRHGIEGIWLHDWYVYALVRAAGLKWFIDPIPQVAYRQHSNNALGAHVGIGAVRTRYNNLRSGLYRDQFVKIYEASLQAGQDAGRDESWISELQQMGDLLKNRSIGARLGIFRRFRQIRRRPADGVALASACVLGVW